MAERDLDSQPLRRSSFERGLNGVGELRVLLAALVERHIDLVHGVALRRTANPHAAEEITQAVFIVLARKAASLNTNVVLSGWLYHAARLTSANYLRTEVRRQRREQEAAMQFTGDEPDPWPQMAPLLEDAMATLRERDRNAIILRFFENKSMAEVGVAIGASEDATRVRVNRAVEKLRKFFGKRGITLSAAALAVALSTQATPAAPPARAAGRSSAAAPPPAAGRACPRPPAATRAAGRGRR